MHKLTVAASVVFLTGFLSGQANSNTYNNYLNTAGQKSSAIILTQDQRDKLGAHKCMYGEIGSNRSFVNKNIAKDKAVERAIKAQSKEQKELAKLTTEKSLAFEIERAATDKNSKDGERAYVENVPAYNFDGWKEDVSARDDIFRLNFAERGSKALNAGMEKGEEKPLDCNDREVDKQVYNEEVIERNGTFNPAENEKAT